MTTAIYLCPLLDSPRPTADSLRLRLEDLEKTIAQLRPCSRLLVVLQQPQLASMHARRERAASWRSLEYLLNAFYTVSFEFIRSHHGSPIGPQVDIVVDGTCGYDPLLNTGVTDGVFVNRSLLSSSDGERLSRVAAGSGYQLHDLAVARSPAVQSAVSHMLTQSFEAFCKQTEIHVEIPAALMARQLPTAHQSVVLGGTFDHFHAGHKILLTMACWLSVDSVICGISSMLQMTLHILYICYIINQAMRC
jgi:hypothetical protein